MLNLPYDSIPEMAPPLRTIKTKAPCGYSRELEMRDDAPYFNASVYCNRINLRFSLWLRHPASIALIQAFNNYYREASHDKSPQLVMMVKGGTRSVHGYYLHMMLHDALSAWCDFELKPREQRPRLPLTTYIYTTQTVINTESSLEQIQQVQADSRTRIANVISAARGGFY